MAKLDLNESSRDLILRVMIAMAAADGEVADVETATIAAVFEAVTGAPADEAEITRTGDAYKKDCSSVTADLAAGERNLDKGTKESIVRAAYLVLRSDGRVAARERKRLVDIAHALKMPEIHITAILEDLEP